MASCGDDVKWDYVVHAGLKQINSCSPETVIPGHSHSASIV